MAEQNTNIKDDSTDKAVKDALHVIQDNFAVRNQQDSIIDNIQALFNEAFLVTDPKGTRKLSSQRLYQAIWRTASRMKPLDFIIHGDSMGRDPVTHAVIQKIVTQGVSTVMDEGGYDSALRDKNGAFFDLLMYGDGLVQIGANDIESDIPIRFSNMSNKNVFTDNYATGIRMGGKGRSAQKVVVIYSYSADEYFMKYPKMKRKTGIGRIQRTATSKDQQRTMQQEYKTEDIIEEAHSYDLSTKTYVIFAGSGNTIREKYTGDNYPFYKDNEAYIPILQFVCIPSSDGFWNYGIGHLLYKLAIISRQLLNMEVSHISYNVNPIELVSLSQGQAAKFFNRLKSAEKMQAQGKRAFVPLERSANDDGGVQSQTLLSQNLFDEWQAVYDRLDQEIRRCGINIDELDVGGTKTATEILALEENANSFIKQIMEWNASETQQAVEITMDMITEFVSKKDKTQINMTTKLEIGGEMQRPEGITLGMVSEELQSRNYFVEVNARTGAIPSNVMMLNRLSLMLPMAQPGSPAQVKITEQIAQIQGVDIPGSEFMAQMPAAPQGQGESQLPESTQMSETERSNIRPNMAMQPAI